MPAPSSRSSRSNVRNSGSSVRKGPAPVPKQEKAATEEIEVEVPTGVEDSSSRASAVSGRRSGARNSKRMTSASGRSSDSGRPSARRPATPEELAKRRQSIRTGLKIAIGVAVTVAIVAVLVLVVFKKDPLAEEASSKLASVQSSLGSISNRAEFVEISKLLASVPDLPAVAQRKAVLKKEIDKLEDKVAKSERDARVVDNRKILLEQLAKLTDPATDLDKLALDCQAFVKNPVDTSAVPDPSLAIEFANAINDIQTRLTSIEVERNRRIAAATTDVAQRVQLDVESLIKAEKFSEASRLIDENAVKYPKADLGRARTYVTESAASAWASVQGYIDNRYKDYASPGITQAVRQKALEEAHARLDVVISTWGIDTYTTQARDLHAKY